MVLSSRTRRRVASRVTRKRSFRRRASTKRQWKVATRAANRVINRRSETKRYITQGENFTTGIGGTGLFQWATRNVFNGLTAGDVDTNVEGSALDRAMLVLRGQFTIDWNSVTVGAGQGADPPSIILHVGVIATNDQLSTSDIVRAADPAWFLSSVPWRVRLDGHHVRVLKWKTYTFHPQGAGQVIAPTASTPIVYGTTDRQIKLKCRFKGKKQFEENPGIASGLDFLKGWNYYILTGWGVAGNAPWVGQDSFKPVLGMDTYLYFKDF